VELSSELISQFVKSTKDTETKSSESTAYGTIVVSGKTYVQLDGSDLLTPISTTTDAKDGERVTVLIKNHTATVTGNISSPSARTDDVKEVGKQITELDIVMAYKITTDNITAVNGYIDNLVSITGKFEELSSITAEFESIKVEFANLEHISATDMEVLNAKIDNLTAEAIDTGILSADDITALEAEIGSLKAYTADFTYVSAESLEAVKADIKTLHTEKLSVDEANIKYATIVRLETSEANITKLQTEKLSAVEADLKYATIGRLEASEGNITKLQTEKLSAEDAKLIYANIDFSNIGVAAIEKLFSDSGIIEELVVSDGKITGELVGVTIKGDLIEGNTIVADKLVVKGEDGLYYKLNTDGATVESEQTDYNSLNGSVITAKSITATKISVDDLVAFDATIGGFVITDKDIHADVKESVDSVAPGIYLDKEGQFSVGDGDNHIKYYKDIDDTYKLEIAAASLAAQIEEATLALKTAVNNVNKHFSFTQDGLVISSGENQMSIRIDNDLVMFEKNGVLFGWWDGINFHTGNILVEVNDRAQFGNFAFIPRSDGSLSFLKVEHNTGFYIRLTGGIMVIYGAYPTLEDTTLLISDISGELDGTTLILGG